MGCDDDDGDALPQYRASGDSKDNRSSAAALRRKVGPISGANFGRIGTPPSKWRGDHLARRRTSNVVPSARRLQKRCRDIPWANWHSAEHGFRTVGARLGNGWSNRKLRSHRSPTSAWLVTRPQSVGKRQMATKDCIGPGSLCWVCSRKNKSAKHPEDVPMEPCTSAVAKCIPTRT